MVVWRSMQKELETLERVQHLNSDGGCESLRYLSKTTTALKIVYFLQRCQT